MALSQSHNPENDKRQASTTSTSVSGPEVNVLKAIIELFEFAYFAGIHEKSANRILRIKIHTLNGHRDDHQAWFQVKVHSYPPGNAFGDLKENIMQGSFMHLRDIVKRNEAYFPDMPHMWDKLFEKENLCQVRHWKVTPPGWTSESTAEKCSQGWSLYFRIFQDVHHMKSEYFKLFSYLQKMKLTNPAITFMLKFNIHGQMTVTELSSSNTTVAIGTRRLEAVLGASLSGEESADVPGNRKVIKPRIGQMFRVNTRPCVSMPDSLKVSCAAWLYPTPANGCLAFNPPVSKLKVLFYGPQEIPLLPPRREIGNLSYLFDLRDYGMTVGDQIHRDDMEALDLVYKVTPTEATDCIEEGLGSEDREISHSLIILVFLTGEGSSIPKTTEKNLGLLYKTRQAFSTICSKFRNRIRKALTTVLNKILHNYRTQDQKQVVLETAVPVIQDALASVVKRSTHEEFRNECFHALEAEDSQSFLARLSERLWELSRKTHDVQIPPNWEQNLVSQQRNSSKEGHKRDRNSSTSTASHREEFQGEDIHCAIKGDNNSANSTSHQTCSGDQQLLTNAESGDGQPSMSKENSITVDEINQPQSVINQLRVVINKELSEFSHKEPNSSQYEYCEDAFSTLEHIEDLNCDLFKLSSTSQDKHLPTPMPITPAAASQPQLKLPFPSHSPGPDWYSDLLTDF